MKEKVEKPEARKARLAERLANADEPPPLLHPNMAALYAQRISQLYEHPEQVKMVAGGRTIHYLQSPHHLSPALLEIDAALLGEVFRAAA